MKQYKIKGLLVLLLFFLVIEIQAQNVTDASGGNATGSGGSVSYSVGQVVYSTSSGSNGSSAQGVQQPYEISNTLSVPEANVIQLMTISPNPTTSSVLLNVGNYDTTKLSFQLIDTNGRVLLDDKINNTESILTIENYPVAIYFLKVLDNDNAVKIFKIIKN